MADYLKILVEQIHSVVVATINDLGLPQTRVIDLMLYDKQGIYFITAKGKNFYQQVIKQKYISLSATQNKIAISLHGKVKNIGYEKLDEIFEKNSYMKKIYPDDTRYALEVFLLYEAQGEYFDISMPSSVIREEIIIGSPLQKNYDYFITDACIGCKTCYSVCPQKCIDTSKTPVAIRQNHCLHCGRCREICPQNAILKRG